MLPAQVKNWEHLGLDSYKPFYTSNGLLNQVTAAPHALSHASYVAPAHMLRRGAALRMRSSR